MLVNTMLHIPYTMTRNASKGMRYRFHHYLCCTVHPMHSVYEMETLSTRGRNTPISYTVHRTAYSIRYPPQYAVIHRAIALLNIVER